jgi:hypothetical protein
VSKLTEEALEAHKREQNKKNERGLFLTKGLVTKKSHYWQVGAKQKGPFFGIAMFILPALPWAAPMGPHFCRKKHTKPVLVCGEKL